MDKAIVDTRAEIERLKKDDSEEYERQAPKLVAMLTKLEAAKRAMELDLDGVAADIAAGRSRQSPSRPCNHWHRVASRRQERDYSMPSVKKANLAAFEARTALYQVVLDGDYKLGHEIVEENGAKATGMFGTRCATAACVPRAPRLTRDTDNASKIRTTHPTSRVRPHDRSWQREGDDGEREAVQPSSPLKKIVSLA
jgi:hypothetical protein